MKIFINIKHNSERVPLKNFRDFGGVSLYKHTLYKLKDFQVFVDTDSQQIIDEVQSDEQCKHVVAYKRLDEHTTSKNPGIDMTKRFLTEYVQDENEPIVVVHVTSPFLNIETIKYAAHKLDMYDSVATVNIIHNFLLRKSYFDGKEVKFIPLNFDMRHIPRTQDLEPIYELNHSLFAFTKKSLFKYDNRLGANPYFIETKFPENLDIDWEHDFKLALAVLKETT